MFDVNHAERAIVRVCAPDGATKGTGFFVNDSGLVLTCDHVVSQLDAILVQTHDGGQRYIGRSTRGQRFPEVDLAIISTGLSSISPLPVDFGYDVGMKVWTKGFQFQSSSITAAFPLRATISGTTNIRYKVGEQLYQPGTVLVLSDAEINEGLSGAPLIDEATGVVVGVVNTRFRQGGGFALPFSGEGKYSRTLNEIIAWNRRHIPRYGGFLNTAGARVLCKTQVQQAIQSLQDNGLFLPEFSFERPDLNERINQFLNSDALIMPVVGPAGTGKTTLLAMMANSFSENRPCLLIRSTWLPQESKNLQDALKNLFQQSNNSISTNVDRLAEVFRFENQHLVILLDGLNEVSPTIRNNIPSWIQRSVDWLEKRSIQLIVTSRPDFWDLTKRYFPKDHLYYDHHSQSDPRTFPSGLLTDDFTFEETKTALWTYGLEESLSSHNDIRHPLLLRIYWEVSLTAPASRYEVYKEYVKRKCEAVALTMNTTPLFVQHLLLKAGKWTYQSGQYTIDPAVFFSQELFGYEREIGERLLTENIFVETQSGVRFAFDEIAEFLQGEQIDVNQAIENTFLKDDESIRMGAIAYAVLKLEYNGDREVARVIIERLVDKFIAHPSVSLGLLLEQIFSSLSEPEYVISALRKFVSKVVQKGGFKGWALGPIDDLWFLTALRLSLTAKFSVYQILAKGEDHSPWEYHHWEKKIPKLLEKEYELATIIGSEIKRDPVPCFRELIKWLEDDTPLAGPRGYTNVQHVAAGLLFHFRHLAFNQLCESLFEVNNETANHLRFLIEKKDPKPMLLLCERWAKDLTPQRQNWIADCGNGVLQSSSIGTQEIQRLIALFRGLLEITTSLEVIGKALHGLYLIEESRETVLSPVIEGYLADKPYLSTSLLGVGLKTHFSAVIEAFKLVLRSGQLEKMEEIFIALSGYRGTNYEYRVILELLESLPLDDPRVTYNVASYIDSQICFVGPPGPPTEALESLIALAKKLIDQTAPRVPTRLIYCTFCQDQPGTLTERMQLLDYIINCANDTETLKKIIGELAAHIDITPDAFNRIFTVGQKLSQEKFEFRLVAESYQYPKFAVAFTEFLRSSPKLNPRFQAKAFLDTVDEGVSPQDAARKVLGLP